MKVANLTKTPEGEGDQATETYAQPDVNHTANPSFPVMHLTKEHLAMMQDQGAHHEGATQVGKKYEIRGHVHVKGSHEDGGAEVHVTHLGMRKHGKSAAEALYGGGEDNASDE